MANIAYSNRSASKSIEDLTTIGSGILSRFLAELPICTIIGKTNAAIIKAVERSFLLCRNKTLNAAGIEIQKAIIALTPSLVAGVYDTRPPGPIANAAARNASGTKTKTFASIRLGPLTSSSPFGCKL
jgi:hypothetical protein